MSNNFHLQLYRGTTAQNDAYTGLSGEVTVDTTLSKLRLHDGSTAGGVEIGGMPVGSIIPYAGTTIPAGYLLCDGSAISRTTYSALFAAIGTTYGAGDGNSTFNIPDTTDGRFLEGSTPSYSGYGTKVDAGVPNIKGGSDGVTLNGGGTTGIGCFAGNNFYTQYSSFVANPNWNIAVGGGETYRDINFDASLSNSIYKDNYNTVQPLALIISFYIKY